MDRRLFPLAELAAFAGILAAGYAIVASDKAAALADSEGRDRQEIARPADRTAARTADREAAPPAPAGKLAPGRAAPVAAARPPVPLVLTARPLRAGQPNQEAQPGQATSPPTSPPTSDGATLAGAVPDQASKKVSSSAAAKAMIEADGYKNVRSVTRAPDGSWRGVAMRGTVEVALSVDGDGRVTAQ